MIRIEIPFIVEKPIELVFQRISNVADYHSWVPQESGFFLGNEITSKGQFGIGTTYMDKLKWRGRAMGKIIAFDPPTKVKFQQTTWFGVKVFTAIGEYTLMGSGSFTEVIHRFEVTAHGIFKLMAPILSPVIRSERERTCKAIKLGLERDPQIPDLKPHSTSVSN